MSTFYITSVCNTLAELNVLFDLINDSQDCCGQIGLLTHQKMTAALQQLTYGTCADILDKYMQIGETKALQTLKYFIKNIIELYATEYLQPPNCKEMKLILSENKARGFPGFIGSIDGMHWAWKNCPTWALLASTKERRRNL